MPATGCDSSRTHETAGSSAAEFSAGHGRRRHRRQRYSLHGGGRQLQLPHGKHPPCNRTGGGGGRFVVLPFVVVLSGERRLPIGAIVAETGKHKIMLRQEPIAFAEFCRRGVLGRRF